MSHKKVEVNFLQSMYNVLIKIKEIIVNSLILFSMG